MRKTAVIVGSLAMLAGAIAANGPVMAATPTPEDRVAELERRLDASAKLIEELNARVRSLEARVPSQGAAATAAAAPSTAPSLTPDAAPQSDEAARLATVEREVSEIAAGASTRNASGLPVHGFADVGAGSRTATDPDHKGFVVGSLDFYLTPELGDRVRSLFELNFEVDEEGEIATDLERAQIGYQVADSATVWLGRFHTPYGYYNTAFHHGQQISMALRRPRFIQFEDEGGVMPAHTVGLWMTGGQRFSSGKWTYDAFMGNAQRIEDGSLNMAQAGLSSAELTYGGNLGYLPGGSLDGLKVGASFLTANVEDDAVVPNRTRVLNFGLYGVYDTDQWENIVEFYHWDNDDRSGATGSHTSYAGFIQVAYRMNRFSPYARYERASLDQGDAYFAAQATGGSYYRSAIGIRFDLDLSAAIKLEVARTVNTDRTRDEFSEAMMQYAIRF
jgi:hypothetical protein